MKDVLSTSTDDSIFLRLTPDMRKNGVLWFFSLSGEPPRVMGVQETRNLGGPELIFAPSTYAIYHIRKGFDGVCECRGFLDGVSMPGRKPPACSKSTEGKL